MGEKAETGREGIDVAALSAGIVAVAVSVYLAPGAYSLLNFVVSVTLIFVILAYVWPVQRSFLQSLAVAAALGLSAIPGIAFIDEAVRSPHPLSYLTGDDSWPCEFNPCTESGDSDSRVETRDLAIAWIVVLLGATAADRLRIQNINKKRTS